MCVHYKIYLSKSKDNDVSQQRAEYERLQKQLEQKLLRVEEELENEKQQLKAFNDEKIKSIEQKHQKKVYVDLLH